VLSKKLTRGRGAEIARPDIVRPDIARPYGTASVDITRLVLVFE